MENKITYDEIAVDRWIVADRAGHTLGKFADQLAVVPEDWGKKTRTEHVAYELYEKNGHKHGLDKQHWHDAEVIVHTQLAHELENAMRAYSVACGLSYWAFIRALRTAITGQESLQEHLIHDKLLELSRDEVQNRIQFVIANYLDRNPYEEAQDSDRYENPASYRHSDPSFRPWPVIPNAGTQSTRVIKEEDIKEVVPQLQHLHGNQAPAVIPQPDKDENTPTMADLKDIDYPTDNSIGNETTDNMKEHRNATGDDNVSDRVPGSFSWGYHPR